MKKHRQFAAAVILVFGSVLALGDEVKIIANRSVRADAITAGEIKSVFLVERNFLRDGTHVEPVLSESSAAHQTFLKDYLAINDEALHNYYRAMVFTGKGLMPKNLRSEAEVVAYVAKTRGAIGYVSSSAAVEGVKTLAVFSSANSGARKLITRVEPTYPEILYAKHIGGMVRLRVTIAASGKVEDAQLVGGNPILAEAAIAAVKRWVYEAGTSRSTDEVTIPFEARR